MSALASVVRAGAVAAVVVAVVVSLPFTRAAHGKGQLRAKGSIGEAAGNP